MKLQTGEPVRSQRILTALAATLTVTTLVGCGSGGGNIHSSSSSGASGTSAMPYADRSYAATSIPLGTNQTGTLTVAVGDDAATIAGTLNVLLTSVSGEGRATRQAATTTPLVVPLTGTLSSATGAFTLNSTVIQNGVTYVATVTGSLGALAKNVAITLNAVSAAATLSNGTALSGQLSATYFPITSNSGFYTETDSSGAASGFGSGYSFLEGYNATTAGTTQVTLNGATVNQLEFFRHSAPGFVYYTESSSALTDYGDDITGLYSPPYVVPFTLNAGQTYSQTGSLTHTDPTSSTSSYTSSYTEAITFNDIETITVTAGTFSTAKVTVVNTTSYPATSPSGAYTSIDTETLYLVQNFGPVGEHDVDVITTAATGSTPASTSTTTDDFTLTSTTGAGASSETRSATKSAHAGRVTLPGIFGWLPGMRR